MGKRRGAALRSYGPKKQSSVSNKFTKKLQEKQEVSFIFTRTLAMNKQVDLYLHGSATCKVRDLLNSRRQLFKSVRALGGGR